MNGNKFLALFYATNSELLIIFLFLTPPLENSLLNPACSTSKNIIVFCFINFYQYLIKRILVIFSLNSRVQSHFPTHPISCPLYNIYLIVWYFCVYGCLVYICVFVKHANSTRGNQRMESDPLQLEL